MPQPDNVKALYNELKNTYELGSEEDFIKYLSDDKNREALRKELESEYDVGDIASFSNYLGFGTGQAAYEQYMDQRNGQSAPAAPTAAQHQPVKPMGAAATLPSWKTSAMPDDVRKRFERQERANEHAQFTKEMDEQLKKMQGMGERMEQKRQAVAKGNSFDTSEQRYNPVTGKVETVYYTKSGDIAPSRMARDLESNEQLHKNIVKEQVAGQVDSMLGDVDKMLNEATERDNEKQRKKEKERGFWGNLGYTLAAQESSNPSAARMPEYGEDVRQLQAAHRKLKSAQNTIAEAQKHAEDPAWLAEFGRGMAHGLTDISTWDFGITDLANANAIQSALEKADKGEQLTDSEQALLDAVATEVIVNEYFGSDVSNWYNGGNSTAVSIPFMASMIISPAMSAGRGASGAMARYITKRFASQAAKKGVQKVTSKVAEGALKGVSRVAIDAAAAAGHTAMFDPLRIEADTKERMMGDIVPTFDSEGNVIYGGHKGDISEAEARGKAFLNYFTENFSEMVGDYIPGMKTIFGNAKWAKKFMGNKFVHGIANMESRAQFHGFIPEMIEEIVNGGMNAWLVGDQTFDANPQTGVFSKDNLATTTISIGATCLTMGLLKLGGYGVSRSQLRKSDMQGAQLFGDDWASIRSRLMSDNLKDVDAAADEIAKNDKYTLEQKKAAVKYATIYAGINAYAHAEKSQEQQSEDQNFDAGYEQAESPEAKADVSERLNEAQRRLDGLVDQQTLQMLDSEEYGADVYNSLPDNAKAAYNEYRQAQAAMDGVQQRISDDADMMAAEQREEAKKKQFRGEGENKGALRPVKITQQSGEPREVFLTQGEIVLTESGLVDPEKTKEVNNVGTLTGYDPATGEEVQFTPADIVEVEPMTTAEQQEQNIEANKQAYIQQQIDAATPTATTTDPKATTSATTADNQQPKPAPAKPKGKPKEFVPGMTLTVTDREGNEHTVTTDGKRYTYNPVTGELTESENGNYLKLTDKNGDVLSYDLSNRGLGSAQEIKDYEMPKEEQPTETVEPTEPPTAEVPTAESITPQQQVTPESTPEPAPVEKADPMKAPMPMRTVTTGKGKNAKTETVPDFYAVPEEKTFDYIYNELGFTPEIADATVKANADETAKTINEHKAKEPQPMANPIAYKEAHDAWQRDLDAMNQQADYWKKVQSIRNQQLLAEAEERDKATRAERERRQKEIEASRKRDEEAYQAELSRRKAERDKKMEASINAMMQMSESEEGKMMEQMAKEFPIEQDAEAMEIMNDRSPRTLEEVVAWMLSDTKDTKNKIDPELVREHTGYGKADFRKFPFIFKKGGMSPEAFGEKVEQIARENDVVFKDNENGFSALLNVLGEVGGLGDLKNYIKENHRKLAEKVHSDRLREAVARKADDKSMQQNSGMNDKQQDNYMASMEQAVESGVTMMTDEETEALFSDDAVDPFESKEENQKTNSNDTRTETNDEGGDQRGAEKGGADESEAGQAGVAADDKRGDIQLEGEPQPAGEQPAGEVASPHTINGVPIVVGTKMTINGKGEGKIFTVYDVNDNGFGEYGFSAKADNGERRIGIRYDDLNDVVEDGTIENVVAPAGEVAEQPEKGASPIGNQTDTPISNQGEGSIENRTKDRIEQLTTRWRNIFRHNTPNPIEDIDKAIEEQNKTIDAINNGQTKAGPFDLMPKEHYEDNKRELEELKALVEQYGLPEIKEPVVKTEGADKPLQKLSDVKKFMQSIGYKGSMSNTMTSSSTGKKIVKYYANGVVTPTITLGETTPRDIWRQFHLYGNIMDVEIPADIKADLDKEREEYRKVQDELQASDIERTKNILTEAGIPFTDVIDSERGIRIVFTDRKNDNGNYVDYTDYADAEQVRDSLNFIRAKAEKSESKEEVKGETNEADAELDALIADYKEKQAAVNKIWNNWLKDKSGAPAKYGNSREIEQEAYDKIRKALRNVSDEQLDGLAKRLADDNLLMFLIEGEQNRREENRERANEFPNGIAEQGDISKESKPVKTDKILPDFTSRDPQHPVQNCIYYDPDGHAVATDGHVLIASKSQYDPKQKGKMVAAHKVKGAAEKGDVLEGKFPNWKSVIPAESEQKTKINLRKLANFLAGAKDIMKGEKEKESSVIVRMPNGDIVGFDPDNLQKFVQAADAMGVKEVEYGSFDKPLIGRSNDGIVVVMPKLIGTSYDGKKFYYDLSDGSIKQQKTGGEATKTSERDRGLLEVVMDKLRKIIGDRLHTTLTEDEKRMINWANAKTKGTAPVFYSNAERAVEGIKQEKATAEQWLAMIQKAGGLKAGEDKWIGLSDWLNDHKGKSLTKQEVMDFIRDNQIQMQEVNYEEGNNRDLQNLANRINDRAEELEMQGLSDDELHDRLLEEFPDMDNMIDDGRLVVEDSMDGGYILRGGVEKNEINPTRLQYTTDFLDNKKEIAFVVPNIESWHDTDEVHFGDAGEGRAVMWVRFGDTTISRKPTEKDVEERVASMPKADQWEKVDGSNFVSKKDVYFAPGTRNQSGHDYIVDNNGKYVVEIGNSRKYLTLPFVKEGYDTIDEAVNAYNEWKAKQEKVNTKILVIDEIQSNRHQEGREKGYRKESTSELIKKQGELERRRIDMVREFQKNHPDDVNNEAWDAFVNSKEYKDILKEESETEDKIRASYNLIPDAPFEKNWHEVAMKRMLRYAAENGYDKVAWTTGEQQADRYDIGAVAKRLVITEDGDNYTIKAQQNDGTSIRQWDNVPKSELPNYVGKDIAAKVESGENLYSKNGQSAHIFTGQDLRIGGEGMKGFYDQILPRFMDKYGKKWGVKTTDVELPNVGDNGLTMHSVEVTPEMKKSVLEGQPMFHKVFHGSGADFERFDSSHMGEGEGAQAYGYGHYTTEVEGIGRTYAYANGNPSVKYVGEKPPTVYARDLANAIADDMLNGKSFEESLQYTIDFLKKDAAKNTDINATGYWKGVTHDREIAFLEGLKESDFEKKDAQRVLYTVEIPDDNGSNYLEWDKKVEARTLKKVANALEEVLKEKGINIKPWTPKFTNGEEVYKTTYDKLKYLINNAGVVNKGYGQDLYQVLESIFNMEGDGAKKASEFLHNAGFTGIKYPAQYRSGGREDGAKNYVIFDDGDLKITDKIKFFKTPQGEVYGFTVGGNIYVDMDIAKADTPIHEYGHLWVPMVRESDPKMWEDIKRVLTKDKDVKPFMDIVRQRYPELTAEGREDDFMEEVFTHFSGDNGLKMLEEAAREYEEKDGQGFISKAKAIAALNKVKEALDKFWGKVAQLFGIKFRNARDVANKMFKDFMDEVDPTKVRTEQTAKRDKEYMEAVEKGDMEKAQRMVDAEARRKGYITDEDYKDAHRAPSASVDRKDFTNLDALAKVVNEDGSDSNLFAMAQGVSLVPDDYFSANGPLWYGYRNWTGGMEAYYNLKNVINDIKRQLDEYGEVRDMPTIKVYRAVPKDIKAGQLESGGQWVSPSREYAVNHGQARFGFGKYRVIEQDVRADELWFDGNDIREWGFDDDTNNAYKNTKNNRKLLDAVTYDDNGNVIPLSKRFNSRNADIRFQKADNKSTERESDGTLFRSLNHESNEVVDNAEVGTKPLSDREKVAKLEAEPKVKVYRSMQLIDGKLYPPMSAKVDGQLREPSELGVWEEADEAPDMADENGKFKLDKGNRKSLKAAYNPYIHTSRTMLNDQFSEAQDRPNLVVVEMEVPESELTSGYKAEKAKDSVGAKQWKAGVIQGQLSGTREVILSRWAKPVRIVPTEEVAENIAKQIEGQVAVMPSNVVTPEVRAALEARGVKFVETDNTGKIKEGPNKGKTWAQVYGKKAPKGREADSLYVFNPYTPYSSYEESLEASKAAGYSKRQHDAMVERRKKNYAERGQRAKNFAEKLNLGDRVVILENADGLEERFQDKKGWYNPRTGKITIVLDKHGSMDDILQTILHEGVGHHGLREMFGKAFDDFLDNVYAGAESDVRQRIIDLAKKHDWNLRTATEEYLSQMAETMDFEKPENKSWWQKVKKFFLDMLHKLGIKGAFAEGDNVISDNELSYILWRSYQNLVNPGRYRSFVDMANDVVMQDKLKVGNFAPKGANTERNEWREEVPMAAEAREGDGIVFRDGGNVTVDKNDVPRAVARDSYERMMDSGANQFKEAVQDSMLSLKKLYEAILGKGTKIEDVEGYKNAYLAENRMHSASQAEIGMWHKDFMEPVVKAIHELTGGKRAAYDDLVKYMMAKHGLERNAVFAERDAQAAAKKGADYDDELQKNRGRDYAGLTALTGEDDVANAEGMAQKMVDDYEADHDTTELWNAINRATKQSLWKLASSGMMTPERYNEIRDMFSYYIPLQGFDETVAENVYSYMGNDGTIGYGTPIRHARGRKSLADDPIATMAMNGEAAIRQANRNEMKKRFLAFAQEHPSDLVSVSEVWLKHNDVTGEWEQVTADLNENDSPADVERKTREFDEKMEQLASNDPDHYKKASDIPNVPFRVVEPSDMKQHQVLVQRGGKKYMLTINGNPRAAQALNGLTNPDVFTEGVFGKAMNLGQWLNRQLSAFYTTRNPEFVLSNFLRDAIYSNSMSWVKESPNYALKFHKNFGKMNPVHMGKLFAQWENGKLRERIKNGTASETDQLFYDFMTNGGETGWTSLRDIEKHKKELQSSLKREGSTSRKAWKALGEAFDLMNRSVENCARFAAFVTSREMGRSIDRSISDAKEVSVNFNKKGAGDKFLTAKNQNLLGKVGASMGGLGRGLYVFFNASMQGLNNIARATKRHPGKAAGVYSTLFALGALAPILAEVLSGGDDDDDKNAYYNLPEYIRRSNICFRFGKDMPWITIPLPIEFRAIYGLGELSTGALTGKEHYTDEEFAKQYVSQLSQVLPLDFMEGGGGWHAFVPSMIKPYVEAQSNTSWTGLPIYRDNTFKPYDPEWTRAYSSANKQLVDATKWLNEATGGDDVTKGFIDWNPAKIEYMLKGYLGGYFTMYDRLQKTAETALGNRDFEWRNIPMASRVLREGDERTEARKLTNEYFDLVDEYNDTKHKVKEYEKISKSDREDAIKYAQKLAYLNNSEEYTRYLLMEYYKPILDQFHDMVKEADGEQSKRIKGEENALRRELINIIHSIDDGAEIDVDAAIDEMLMGILNDEQSDISLRKKAQNTIKKHRKAMAASQQ